RLDSNSKEGLWLPLESQYHTDNAGNWVNNICFASLCLEPGTYALLIRAVDPDGNKDPTPARYAFSVEE
ncbi:MAG: hypothetical protein KJ905_03700, partial [Nanoarchaeota archaeon]|nr:hypothetical protein [Nanoarchaeota archaeon]MBU1501845.1 hypothetical protein [Nanoarchaeota archaeon]